MPYILIIVFAAVAGPPRIDHVDSVRFDDQKACTSALNGISSNAPRPYNPKTGNNQVVNIIQIVCVPASMPN